MPPPAAPLLAVDGLTVTYRAERRQTAVRDVSFAINAREAYGLVGESGCGKSTIALAIMRYLPANGRVAGGQITFDGRDLLRLSTRDLQRLRGDRIAMVYQDPGAALNPTMTVGDQVAEVFAAHRGLDRRRARAAAVQIFESVRMPGAADVARRYPHQLSGGMQQRAIIAMALATNPSLLILDEPTTGLDATVEATVLDLIAAIRAEFDAAILLISHNLAVVSRLCDRVGVVYAGELVEQGPTATMFASPHHPYTAGLLSCVPRFGMRKDTDPLVPIAGRMPRIGETFPGCTFAPRCPLAREVCRREKPALFATTTGRRARCFFWPEVLNPLAAHPRGAPEGGACSWRWITMPPPVLKGTLSAWARGRLEEGGGRSVTRFLARRLGLLLLTLWLMSILVFVVTSVLPGDVAHTILGQHATPEAVAGLRNSLT